MKTLDQVIQGQIDEIMDTFDFERCSEALRVVEHCWLNRCNAEDRVYELKKSARERIRNAVEIAKASTNPSADSFSDSGCLRAECTICREGNEAPWVRINLTCHVDTSLMDGEEFAE